MQLLKKQNLAPLSCQKRLETRPVKHTCLLKILSTDFIYYLKNKFFIAFDYGKLSVNSYTFDDQRNQLCC